MERRVRVLVMIMVVCTSAFITLAWLTMIAPAEVGLAKSSVPIHSPVDKGISIAETSNSFTDTARGQGWIHHSLTNVGEDLYLFGGVFGQSVTETATSDQLWRYELISNEWTIVPSTARPQGRQNHAAAAYNGALYILGGQGANKQKLDDVWRFDPKTGAWTQVPQETTPPARSGHTAVGATDGIWVFGGSQTTPANPNYLWKYNPQMEWWSVSILGNPVGSRPGHSAGFLNNSMYLVGGVVTKTTYTNASESITATTFFLQRTDENGNQFFTVNVSSTEKPAPRQNQATAFDTEANAIYIFGGEDHDTGDFLKDAWKFDIASSSWTRLADLPLAVSGSKAAAYHLSSTNRTLKSADAFANGLRIMIIGGEDEEGNLISSGYQFDGAEYEPVVIKVDDYNLFLPMIEFK